MHAHHFHNCTLKLQSQLINPGELDCKVVFNLVATSESNGIWNKFAECCTCTILFHIGIVILLSDFLKSKETVDSS